MSCARELAALHPDLRVVLVERAYAGSGASGRNTGYLNFSCVGHHPADLVHKVGPERARELSIFAERGYDEVRRLVAEHNIDCELEETGLAYTAVDAYQDREVQRMAAAWCAMGHTGGRVWSGKDCQGQIGSPHFTSAFYDSKASCINPFKLARGLLDRVVVPLANVRVYEGTAVTALKVTTKNGTTAVLENGMRIHARAAAVNTMNVYNHDLAPYSRSFCPFHVYSIVTQPLSDEQLARLSYRSRVGCYTLHDILYAFRLTKDNRLVYATGDATYHGNRMHVPESHIYERLEKAMHAVHDGRLPVDLKIASRWEGVIGLNFDDIPIMGSLLPRDRSLYHAYAYCGHGVCLSQACGRLVATQFYHDHLHPGTGPLLRLPSPPPSARDPGEVVATWQVSPSLACARSSADIPVPPWVWARCAIDSTYLQLLRQRNDWFDSLSLFRRDRTFVSRVFAQIGLFLTRPDVMTYSTIVIIAFVVYFMASLYLTLW
mmetsp:Transcript_32734/g.91677  ORF Transcript_32734/g.91677 Transcript_32734/m.91677 type:complete len:490 (+) Transcript_32734:257-1726(+)